MPQAEHQHTIYAPLQFVDERQSARPRGYSEIFSRSYRVMEVSTQDESVRIDDSGELPIEELLALYEPVRNELAYRRLKGDSLSQREQLVLKRARG